MAHRRIAIPKHVDSLHALASWELGPQAKPEDDQFVGAVVGDTSGVSVHLEPQWSATHWRVGRKLRGDPAYRAKILYVRHGRLCLRENRLQLPPTASLDTR